MEKNELPCGVVLAILGIAVLIAVFLINRPVMPSDWASWVQAFGSIGAIVGAYFFGEAQAKRSEKLQRSLAQEEVEKRRAAFYAIAASTGHLADEIKNMFTPKEHAWQVHHMYYEDSMVDSYMDVLRAVPVHEIGSAIAVREFIALNESLGKLKICVKLWKDMNEKTNVTTEQRFELEAGALRVMDSVVEALKRRIEKIHAAMYPSADFASVENARASSTHPVLS
ncbi:hypothetical protein WJ974_00580 [Achromobacter xylosoxidans]